MIFTKTDIKFRAQMHLVWAMEDAIAQAKEDTSVTEDVVEQMIKQLARINKFFFF